VNVSGRVSVQATTLQKVSDGKTEELATFFFLPRNKASIGELIQMLWGLVKKSQGKRLRTFRRTSGPSTIENEETVDNSLLGKSTVEIGGGRSSLKGKAAGTPLLLRAARKRGAAQSVRRIYLQGERRGKKM